MTVEASLTHIEGAVRERVRRSGVDPSRSDDPAFEKLVDEVLHEYEGSLDGNDLPPLGDQTVVRKAVIDRIAGFGPLQPFFDDPTIEEIWINGPGKVFCAQDGVHRLTNVVLSDQEIAELVERMLRTSGRRLDVSSPFVDAVLADGSRLHVVIPDITRRHWAVNIRKFVLRAHRLEELVRLGSLPPAAAAFLQAAVEAGSNIVVAGGTQSGKTTMLNCLAGCIPSRARVITCEEVFELQVSLPDVVSLQTRPANLEGEGAIDLRRLIIEALRMRPDRIIVGEVRQQEALDLLVALNSGFPGMTSIHANSAAEALTKLTTLPLLAGENVSHGFVLPTVAGCIDLVVHLGRLGGQRVTREIVSVGARVEAQRIETAPLFGRRSGELKWTGSLPLKRDKFEEAGIDLHRVLT
jgi:pilus assembly protein CpaF